MQKSFIWALVAVFAGLCGVAAQQKNASPGTSRSKQQGAAAPVQFLTPATLAKPTGYTPVVVARPGKIIYIAGQVAQDKAGNLVGAGDMRAQAQQVFENLNAALADAGATFKNVVKLNYYVLDATQLPAVREVRNRFVDAAEPPASTAVEVKGLFREGYLIEVEAVAIVPD